MDNKPKIPKGLSWIRSILILGIVGGIIALILKNTFIPIIGIFGGLVGDIFIVVSILVTFIIVVGITKRKEYTYNISLIWFAVQILVSIASFVISFNFMDLMRIFLYLLFIWYMMKMRDYFFHRDIPFDHENPVIKKQEKIMKYGILLFIIIMVAAPQLSEIYMVAMIMPGFGKLEVSDALNMCREKNQNEMDFCIYYLVKLKRDDYDFGNGEVCQEISSIYYKDQCYLYVYQCDKITDEGTRQICYSLSKISTKTDNNPPTQPTGGSNLTQRPN